jgi:predicted MPP superfamily phosphohydrolase
MKLRYSFFIIAVLILLFVLVYTIVRGMQALTSFGNWKFVYLGASILLLACLIVGMTFENSMPQSVAKITVFAGYSYLILISYLFLSFLVIDIVRIINHFLPFIVNVQSFRMWAFLVTLIVTFVAMIAGNYKFNHPKVVNLEIQSNKPLQGKEMKIVVASDVHLGTSIDKKRLKSYVRLINSQNPDLVLFAGDLIDRSIKPVVKQHLDDELKMITPPLGVYAILGNHEYYGEDGDMLTDFYKKAHIQLLRDSSALINNEMYIIGRDDKTNVQRKPLEQLMLSVDKSKPEILLDHQPAELNDAVKNNIDLQLSGHTHDGQFFPGNLIARAVFERSYGYLKKGNTQYYVSSGLGLWGPQYRIGTQSEIVVIHFKY